MALVLMNRAAIIDLGTNTFNLLIVEQSGTGYQIIFKTKIPAKLGAGGFEQRIITKEAFQRGVGAILSHHDTIQEHGVEKVYAFATSAMRDAQNGADFVREVAVQTGIEINIISGEREAELIYKGVQLALDFSENPELIVDIGGGSTEFIIANNKGIIWKHSFDLGVSRLFEQLKPSDPLTKEDIKKFVSFLDEQLEPLFQALKEHPVSGLIGSSGSFESLADMILAASGKRKKLKRTEYKFKLEKLKSLHQKLISSTAKERAKMKGLVAFRIETIPLASSFIHYLLNKLSLTKLRLSTYALREGVISELTT